MDHSSIPSLTPFRRGGYRPKRSPHRAGWRVTSPRWSVHNRADGDLQVYAGAFDPDRHLPGFKRHRQALDRALDVVTDENVVPILKEIDKTFRYLENNHVKVVEPAVAKLRKLYVDLEEANIEAFGPEPSRWQRFARTMGWRV